MLRGNPAMDQHPNQGIVAILLVSSCCGNWDKLWLGGPGDSSTYLTLPKKFRANSPVRIQPQPLIWPVLEFLEHQVRLTKKSSYY